MHNVILILSHKRPNCQTVKALENSGYNGEWFIVADDLDSTDYEAIYPNHVIRFCKLEYANNTDTIDNFVKLTSCVYARNACIDIAKQKRFDCIGIFDDDITDFYYRYISNNKLLSKKVKNLSEVFDAYCNYILQAKIACGAFVSSGRIIGGRQNPIVSKNGGFYHIPTNVYIINTNIEQLRFIGTIWDDCIYCYQNNMTGRIVRAFMPIVFSMVPPGSLNEGGNKELYISGSSYISESYANIAIPSFFSWIDGGKKHKLSSDLPKILPEKWRKTDA